MVSQCFRPHAEKLPSQSAPRTQQRRPVCWMRTQQKDGRAGSASGQTSTRRLWPTSTALMSRRYCNFTVPPAPLCPRQRAAPQRPHPPHRSMPRLTLWIPSTALSWPVTTQCLAHRCRSAWLLIQTHNCTFGPNSIQIQIWVASGSIQT